MSTLSDNNNSSIEDNRTLGENKLNNKLESEQGRINSLWLRVKTDRLLFLIIFPMIWLVLTPSCDQTIKQFTVQPAHVCSERPVTLNWKTKGTMTMISADRTVSQPLGVVPASGEMNVVVGQTTTFTIESKLQNQTAKEKATVKLFSEEGDIISIGGQPLCDSGFWKYSEVLEQREWDEMIRVDSVKNIGSQPIQLVHGGMIINLGIQKSSREIAGSPIVGNWIVMTPLRTGEDCSSSNIPREGSRKQFPPYLGIEISASCQYP